MPATVNAPLFPPVNQTVVPGNVTEVVDPTLVMVPPAPADASDVASQVQTDDSTNPAPVAEPTTPIAG